MSVLTASEIKKSNSQVRLQTPQEFIKIKVFYCNFVVFCCILLYFCIDIWVFFNYSQKKNVIQSYKFMEKVNFQLHIWVYLLSHTHIHFSKPCCFCPYILCPTPWLGITCPDIHFGQPLHSCLSPCQWINCAPRTVLPFQAPHLTLDVLIMQFGICLSNCGLL